MGGGSGGTLTLESTSSTLESTSSTLESTSSTLKPQFQTLKPQFQTLNPREFGENEDYHDGRASSLPVRCRARCRSLPFGGSRW